MQKIYTMKELVKILNLSEVTIRKLMNDGKIKRLDLAAVRVTEEALKEFLKGK